MADLPTQSDFEDFADWAGRDVLAPSGDRLGAVDQIFLDEATGTPEWVLVSLDDGAAFVPLAGATVEERAIRVDQDAERVQAAPRLDAGETLSVGDEKRLYEHYGLEYSQAESSTVLPEGAATEERPRLRKYIGAPVAAPARRSPRRRRRPSPRRSEPSEPGGGAEARGRVDGPAQPQRRHALAPAPAQARGAPAPGRLPSTRSRSPAGSKLRTAIPIALAGAIAGLIAVLAWRRSAGASPPGRRARRARTRGRTASTRACRSG